MQCILSNLREKRFEMLTDLTNLYGLMVDCCREKNPSLIRVMAAIAYKIRICEPNLSEEKIKINI